jgi:hypothetical protein
MPNFKFHEEQHERTGKLDFPMRLMETGEGTFFLLMMTEGTDVGRVEVFMYAKKMFSL